MFPFSLSGPIHEVSRRPVTASQLCHEAEEWQKDKDVGQERQRLSNQDSSRTQRKRSKGKIQDGPDSLTNSVRCSANILPQLWSAGGWRCSSLAKAAIQRFGKGPQHQFQVPSLVIYSRKTKSEVVPAAGEGAWTGPTCAHYNCAVLSLKLQKPKTKQSVQVGCRDSCPHSLYWKNGGSRITVSSKPTWDIKGALLKKTKKW